MIENQERSLSQSPPTRWNIDDLSTSGQIKGFVDSERLPILKHNSYSRSLSGSGAQCINSHHLNRDTVSEMILDEIEDSSQLNNCCRGYCLTHCSLCRGTTFRRMFYDRFPKGKALFFVLFINTLESFALFGAFDGLKERMSGSRNDKVNFGYIFVFFQWCGGRIFYPITGLIADTCLGRYRMIRIGLWLMWIGFVLITINENLIYANIDCDILETYIVPCAAVILLIISSASVEANIIPFGVDQIQQGAPSSEIISYFYYYYFSRMAGIFLGLVLFLSLFDTNISLLPGSNLDAMDDHHFTFHSLNATHPLFAVLSVTVALVLHICAQQQYSMDRDYSNPLRLIINVLYFAATVKRKAPRYRRAFRYGEEKKPRIELAKRDFDGIFTSEEVEDVKTFFRISIVIFSLCGCFLAYGMTLSILVFQITDISTVVFGSEQHVFLSHELFQLFYYFFTLLTIILMSHVVIPLFPGFRMKQKIGLGVVFTALSPAVAMIAQFALRNIDSHSLTHLLWLIVPTLFLSVGHTNVFTAGLEFIYAQSPNSMKGLLTGVFFLWYGIFNGIGIIYFGIFPSEYRNDTEAVPCMGIYFTLTTFVGIVSIAMYAVVACIYRNRVRPNNDEDVEDDAVRRGMYGTVSTLNFPDDI